MKRIILLSLFLCSTLAGKSQLSLVTFATGLSQPLDIQNAGDSRLFIVERTGYIKILDSTGTAYPGYFLDIHTIVETSYGEEGLLGLAFDPDYANTGYFYCYYTQKNTWAIRVSRFSVSGTNPDSAVAASEFPLITIYHHSYQNHNGGGIGFGPDGYLYFGTGDGGSGNDPGNRAQNKDSLLGKMLRIDVSGGGAYSIPASNPFVGQPNARGEIWAYGLRNPWRWSFDKLTGDFWIGDVGQNAWEEIDYRPASSTGGENYGWRCYEGLVHTSGVSPVCSPTDTVNPIRVVNHSTGVIAIIGGYVYRGAQYANLYGKYFYSDESTSSIGVRTITHVGNNFYDSAGVAHGGTFVSFGQDRYGELYIAEYGGTIYRIQGAACSPVARLGDLDTVHVCGSSHLLSTPQGGGFSYVWTFNGNAIGGADSSTFLALQEGSYGVTVYDTAFCSAVANPVYLTFDSVPVASITTIIDTLYCVNHASVSLSGNPSGGTFYLDGNTITSFDPAAAGVGMHSIVYQFTSVAGCSDTASHQLRVDACLGFDEQSFLPGLFIYPNPSGNNFNISFSTLKWQVVSIVLTDMLGKLISQEDYNLEAGQQKIPMHLQLDQGVYFLRVMTDNGIATRRLVINR